MIDSTLAWAITHPMNALGLMVGIALVLGVAGLSSEIRQLIGRSNSCHPRC